MSIQATTPAAALAAGEVEYRNLVTTLRAQVAARLARVAKFTPRSSAEVKRDFAAHAVRAADPTVALVNGEGACGQDGPTMADLTDDGAEAAYACAVQCVAGTAKLLRDYQRDLVDPLDAVDVSGIDPDVMQALVRVASQVAESAQRAFELFDSVMSACEAAPPEVPSALLQVQKLLPRTRGYGLDFERPTDRGMAFLDGSGLAA